MQLLTQELVKQHAQQSIARNTQLMYNAGTSTFVVQAGAADGKLLCRIMHASTRHNAKKYDWNAPLAGASSFENMARWISNTINNVAMSTSADVELAVH